MQLRWVRFRIRSLMIAVPIVAMGLGLVINIPRRTERCTATGALYHQRQMELWRYDAMKDVQFRGCTFGSPCSICPDQELVEEHTRLYGPKAGYAYKRLTHHWRLKTAYEEAWYHPWASLFTDPFGP